MLIYVLGFLLTTFFIYFSKLNYNRYKHAIVKGTIESRRLLNLKLKYYLFFVLAFLPLFLISAFRFDVGTDYMYTYYPNFYSILDGNREYSEFGFYLINIFIQLFTHDSFWLFFVTSFIFVLCLLRCVIKYSSNSIISMIVIFLTGIYFVSLNNVRQSISSVIMLLAFDTIYKKKTLKFLIYVFIATIFHYSALIMILFYIFLNIKFVQKHFMKVLLGILILMPVIANLAVMIIMQTKYSYFLTSDFNNGQVTIVNIIYGVVIFAISYILLHRNIGSNRKVYILMFSQFMYLMISMMSIFISVSELISRLSYYFLLYQIILIPQLYVSQRDIRSKLSLILFYIGIYGVYFYYYFVVKGYHAVLPYQFIR